MSSASGGSRGSADRSTSGLVHRLGSLVHPRSSGGAAPWPIRIRGFTPAGEVVTLRPLTVSDKGEFEAVRRANRAWLEPWDATTPEGSAARLAGFKELVRYYDREARAGRMLPFVVTLDERIVGQMNVSNIIYGAFRSCAAGYWVSRSVAGRGVTPTALAIAGDHAFSVLGLHRIEVNIRPENGPSLAVVRKLGFRDEGVRRRMLHIDGDWRDHRSFALTTEDLQGGTLMDRLKHQQHQSHPRHTGAGPR